MKKILFLALLTIMIVLSVRNIGKAQASDNCEMKVRCSKLDSAAVLIEKGKNCEYQLDLYKQIHGHYMNLTRLQESDNLMYIDTLAKMRIKIYDYEGLVKYQKEKIKHKNQKLVGSIAMNILLLFLLL